MRICRSQLFWELDVVKASFSNVYYPHDITIERVPHTKPLRCVRCMIEI